MRVFFAVPLDVTIANQVERVMARWQEQLPEVRWVRGKALHLTLAFLGEQEEEIVNRFMDGCKNCFANMAPFPLTFQGIGGFPNLTHPQVIWLGVTSGGEMLTELVTRLHAPLVGGGIGIDRAAKTYHPHLTLGRVKSLGKFVVKQLLEMQQVLKEEVFGPTWVHGVSLLESKLSPTGPSYRVLKTFTFQQEGGSLS